jgi:hypothetical protein
MVTYIKHIVWRFAKYNPEQFKLLDFRYDLMKSLILGDCDHLIKFILFGCENFSEEKENEFKTRHIPKNIFWPGERFLKDDDLHFDYFDKNDNKLKNNEVPINAINDMELAIYHCKGKF